MSRMLKPLSLALLLTAAPLALAQTPSSDELVLNLRDVEIAGLIEIVSQNTGINFVVDPRVRGQVSVISGQPIKRDRLYDLFLSVLKSYGFAAIAAHDGTVRIVPEAHAKENQIAQLSAQSRQDEFITHLIKVEHLDAAQVVRTLRPLVPKGGHLAAEPNANAIVIADTAANVRRIQQLLTRMDQPSSTGFEVVPLNQGHAVELARTLENLPKASEELVRKVTVLPDERTNALIVVGSSSARRAYRQLIQKLDRPSDQGNTQVHYLRYAKALEVANVLRGISQGREPHGQASASSPALTPNEQRQDSNVRIEAHESTNAVVVHGPAEMAREMAAIIAKLDIRRAQVLVEAVIAEVSYDRAKELGVQWGFGNENSGIGVINFSRGAGGLLNLAAGLDGFWNGDLPYPPPIPDGATLGGVGRVGSTQIGFLLNALQGDSASNILSTPSLLTLDNEEAEIVVGQNVPFIVGRAVEDSGQAFDSIERNDVGIKLRIRPQINEGNAVRLEIKQEVSKLAPQATGAADLITNKRSLSTHVMVDDNQLVVLGGLIDDQVVETQSKVPWLGDVPGLGRLFRYDTANVEKRNLMVFLRPIIVRDAALAQSLSQAKYSHMREQQFQAQDQSNNLLPSTTPVLVEWSELLTLPPAFGAAPALSIAAPPEGL